MSARYEILLPLKYNDGREIEPQKFFQTRRELLDKFGALTFEPQPREGAWTMEGVSYEDLVFKIIVDVKTDTPAVRAFFTRYKEVLKERFQQHDIWLVSIPIRII